MVPPVKNWRNLSKKVKKEYFRNEPDPKSPNFSDASICINFTETV